MEGEHKPPWAGVGGNHRSFKGRFSGSLGHRAQLPEGAGSPRKRVRILSAGPAKAQLLGAAQLRRWAWTPLPPTRCVAAEMALHVR